PAGRLLLRLELDRNRVDAVAKPGGVRPVVEDVAQVAAALRTSDFRPHHEVAGVDVLLRRRATWAHRSLASRSGRRTWSPRRTAPPRTRRSGKRLASGCPSTRP